MVTARRVLDWQQRLEDLACEIEVAGESCADRDISMILESMAEQLNEMGERLEDCRADE